MFNIIFNARTGIDIVEAKGLKVINIYDDEPIIEEVEDEAVEEGGVSWGKCYIRQ